MIYINNAPFGDKSFPNGETIFDMGTYYVKDAVNEIKLVYESDADIFKLIVAKKCLDKQSKENRVDYGWDEAIITLTIAYMPYSRMDRQMSSMAFSLRYVAEVINSLNFDSVTILTPHSNVTPALINNVRTIYDIGVNEAYKYSSPDYVFYPDNGACKSFGEHLKYTNYFYGNKKRELSTGKIEKYELVNAPDIKGKNILIIDDLCVKGGTFILAAQALKAAGAAKVDLFVTHLEKAVYEGILLTTDWIDHIYTINTLEIPIENDKITEIRGNFI